MNSTQIPATDPHVEATDAPRLRGQNARIYAALKQGPKTNAELAAIALKYTSRLSCLRDAGIAVTCTRQSGGTFVYTLDDAMAAANGGEL